MKYENFDDRFGEVLCASFFVLVFVILSVVSCSKPIPPHKYESITKESISNIVIEVTRARFEALEKRCK